MKPVLLIDFGSTYTKVTAVDVDKPKILGTSQSFTTINTDINEGLNNALNLLEDSIGKIDFVEKYACSSAAGGLKIVSVGLVPELTAKAAKMASLGAGGKVLDVFSYQLNSEDIKRIEELGPEIVLLVGGTDGGNTDVIIHNAHSIARAKGNFAVIVAGNRNATEKCQDIISKTHMVYVCQNVMPKFNELNIEPVQNLIREIFLKRIISAKGLSQAQDLISGIVNPTPAAVLKGIKLLADGTDSTPGIGELLAIDVGGATTDVYSICRGDPTRSNVVLKGLPEPYAKRTVEGDIGMRYSIKGILASSSIDQISALSGIKPEKTQSMIDYLSQNTDKIPEDAEYKNLDYALACEAVNTAVERHAGQLEQVYTAMGVSYLQTGKDLANVHSIVVTGGSLIHTLNTDKIASCAFCNMRSPNSLRPTSANIYVDRQYIIASMGLLSEYYPEQALQLLLSNLEDLGHKMSDLSTRDIDSGSAFDPSFNFGCNCH